MCGTEEERAERSFYLHCFPGAHYPDDITHAQKALCRIFMLIELLNDVEAFKTNSVWWLNVMDFQRFCLLRDKNPSYDDEF